MTNLTKLSEYDYEAEKKSMRQGDFLHHKSGNSLPWSAPNSMMCFPWCYIYQIYFGTFSLGTSRVFNRLSQCRSLTRAPTIAKRETAL